MNKYINLIYLNTVYIISCLKDVVAKTYKALSLILNQAREC